MESKLFLTLLFISCLVWSLEAASGDDTPKDVKEWCNTTPYPDVCKAQCKSKVPLNKSGFRKTAVQACIHEALAAQTHNKGLGKKCRDKKEKAAWDDCLVLYQNTIHQLNHTIDSNTKHTDDDIQTWLSTALTDLETCKSGFVDFGETDYILPQVTNNSLSELISNTLSINKVNGSREESTKDGFPSWVTPGTRKLLQASTPNMVVAQDGSGDYRTVSAAIAAASGMTRTGRFVIRIRAGTYQENVVIGNDLENIMLVGDGMSNTVITASLSVGGGSTTFNSGTVIVTGDGFIAQGITFRNTAGPQNNQAVALRSGADLSVFYRCGFEAYQDTLYVHSQRQFYKECNIYGTVDFIFGNAAVVLQNCMIYARRGMAGQRNMVTAQGRTDPNQNTGISIQDSRVMAAADLAPVLSTYRSYLGRPWRLYSRTVFLTSYLDTLIDPTGWFPWDGDFALDTLYYGEYRNTGPGASTANRVTWPGYRVITSSTEASQFTVSSLIAGQNWLPATGVPFKAGL